MKNYCGINNKINTNIDINPNYKLISKITNNDNFLPILHNLFEKYINFIYKNYISIWINNYNKMLNKLKEIFIKNKCLKNIEVLEADNSLIVDNINVFNKIFYNAGVINLLLNDTYDNNNKNNIFDVDIKRVYSYHFPDGLGPVKLTIKTQKDFLKDNNVEKGNCILVINGKKKIKLFSNLLN